MAHVNELKSSRFTIEKEIGKGNFATVYKVRDTTDLQIYAMKKILLTPTTTKLVSNEFMISLILNHPNIPKTYMAFSENNNDSNDDSDDDFDFDDNFIKKVSISKNKNKNYAYMISKYISGTDLWTLVKNRPLSKATVKKFIGQLLSALAYCHGLHICHLDIKPQNILIDKNKNIQLLDWGFSQKDIRKVAGLRGTPNYMSPEMIQKKLEHCDKADIWAVGIITFVCLAGKTPYENKERDALFKEIVNEDIKFPDLFTADDITFIRSILRKEPLNRPSAKELLKSSWFKS